MIDALVAVGAGTAMFLGSHVFLWRTFPSMHPRIWLLVLLGAIGIATAVWVMSARSGLDPLEAVAVVWMQLLVVAFYLFVYAGLVRSVSVTVLVRLLETAGGRLPLDTLVTEYIWSSRFEDRITLMSNSGLVSLSCGRIHLTGKGLRLARSAAVAGRLFGCELGG